jgi:hypothetical protein
MLNEWQKQGSRNFRKEDIESTVPLRKGSMADGQGAKENVGIEELNLKQPRYSEYVCCDIWRVTHK